MSVFRKSSLDKLSSPEQLDRLVKLTSPRSWMVVAFFGLMITATLIWSVVGTIPTKIQAQGIFISSNGTNNIFSTVNGQISDVTIQKDEYVHKGDVIARISQSSISDGSQAVEKQIEDIKNYTLDGNSVVSDNTLDLYGIKNQINDIKNQINKMKIDYNSSKILNDITSNALEIKRSKGNVAAKNNALAAASDQLETYKKLLDLKQIGQADYNQAVAAKDAAQSNLNNEQISLEEYVQNQNNLQEQYKQSKEQFISQENYLNSQKVTLEGNFNATKSSKLDTLSKKILEIKQNLQKSDIVSTVEGQVLSINIAKGNYVQIGSEVATVLQKGSDVNESSVIFYAPIQNGKKLLPGMLINVYPTTVNRQEYGHMVAIITNVSDYAASAIDMKSKLGNDQLVNSFLNAGVLVEVDAYVIKDPSTKSGFYWSSKKGKTVSILQGTICDSSITIETNKPITLVLPLLKEKLSPFN